MKCRSNCAACCIALSISSAIPGMPLGKAAGEKCVHLDKKLRCAIFGQAKRPLTCINFKPELEFCGNSQEEAFAILKSLVEELE